MNRTICFILGILLVIGIFGCSSQGVQKKITEAERIIEEAVDIGAELRAPVPLEVAREKLDYAKELIELGKTDSALTMSALAVESAREALQTTKEFNSIPDAGR